jgi:hypothetical protein
MRSVGLSIAMLAVTLIAVSCGDKPMNDNVIVQNDRFTVTGDSVIEGDFVAAALSPTHIVTNYKSPVLTDSSSVVAFRLSFNSHDNEMPSGFYHYALPGSDTTVVAGVPGDTVPDDHSGFKGDVVTWNLRVDLSAMEKSFKDHGWFVTARGDTVFRREFKGVWVAGNIAPLTWDYDNLYNRRDLQLHPTSQPGIYALTLRLKKKPAPHRDRKGWEIDAPSEQYPQYSSSHTLVDALYNMSIDDISKRFRLSSVGTMSAGQVGYPVYLSLAYLNPSKSKAALRALVKNGLILQNGGIGGSWPVINNRIIWATAAWEVYNVTGDKQWLRYAYGVIKNTVKNDYDVAYNKSVDLFYGGSPYQSYPSWMEPKDIYECMCLSTNIIFEHAYEILDEMSDELNINDDEFGVIADRMKDGINQKLWNESYGYYNEYLYGTAYPVRSSGVNNLGQALGVLWDIADDDRAETLIESTLVTDYGVPVFDPFHINSLNPFSNSVSPVVQALWNMAAAKVGNENMLRRGLGAMYRAEALFASNKVMFNAYNGQLTAASGDKSLGAAAGNAAMIFRVFAGMTFIPDGIEFDPYVPSCLAENKYIKGFKYRNSTLDITIEGCGSEVDVMTIDGKKIDDEFFPASMTGHHSIVIRLKPGKRNSQQVTLAGKKISMPPAPAVAWNSTVARILNFATRQGYKMIVNGNAGYIANDTVVKLPKVNGFTVFSLMSINKYGQSYMSRPYRSFARAQILQVEDFAPSGTVFVDKERAKHVVEVSVGRNTDISIPVTVDAAGYYFLDVRYANGSGPVNSGDKCAVRSVFANTHLQGVVVMPQRGAGEWMNMDFSNMVSVELLKGKNVIELKYVNPCDVNVSRNVNTALIDFVRLIKK